MIFFFIYLGKVLLSPDAFFFLSSAQQCSASCSYTHSHLGAVQYNQFSSVGQDVVVHVVHSRLFPAALGTSQSFFAILSMELQKLLSIFKGGNF